MNRGLGRGLDALLGGTQTAASADNAEVLSIAIEDIIPNPHQPRREFSQESLADLAASISSQGVLQPILVRPLDGRQYELVAGERRHRASRLAGLNEIPALVREMTDQESLAIALIENLQREDLNPIEESLGYQQLQKEFGLSQEELAKQVGKSRSAVANALRLLNLPDNVIDSIQKGIITAGHGRALMAVDDLASLNELHQRIVENGLTVRQVEAQASFFKQSSKLPGAGEEALMLTTKKNSSAPKELDPVLQELQEAISDELGLLVKASGSLKKGKIQIAFNGSDELQSLADKLGVTLDLD